MLSHITEERGMGFRTLDFNSGGSVFIAETAPNKEAHTSHGTVAFGIEGKVEKSFQKQWYQPP
jgi:hypothetical protein